jgi:hypothetical protein
MHAGTHDDADREEFREDFHQRRRNIVTLMHLVSTNPWIMCTGNVSHRCRSHVNNINGPINELSTEN